MSLYCNRIILQSPSFQFGRPRNTLICISRLQWLLAYFLHRGSWAYDIGIITEFIRVCVCLVVFGTVDGYSLNLITTSCHQVK